MDLEDICSLMLVIGIVLLLSWGGTYGVNYVVFDRECGGHLVRAANANSIELAREEMQMALKYIEHEGLTQGYTSIFWNTPDEDMEFWYRNLKTATEELDRVQPDTSQLERSNILMKLRESLQDNGKNGSYTIVPQGISIYPNNGAMTFLFFISVLLIILPCIFMSL